MRSDARSTARARLKALSAHRGLAPAVLGICTMYAAWSAFALWARGLAELRVPLGPDGGQWAMACAARASGARIVLPALFPWLGGHLGAGPVEGPLTANAVAMVLAALLAALSAWVASPRAGLAAAVAATLWTVTATHLYAYAWYVQPEVVAAAALTAVALAGLAALRWPGPWTALGWGAALGLMLSAREHGLVTLLAAVPVALLVWTGGARQRLTWLLLLVLGVQLGYALPTGQWFTPFFLENETLHKATLALKDTARLSRGELPVEYAPRDITDELIQGATGLDLVRQMVSRAWTISAPERLLQAGALLGLLGLVWRRRWRTTLVLLVPLATLAPASFVWTQWRHYLVLGPVCVVLLVVALAELLPRAWMLLGFAVLSSFITARSMSSDIGGVVARVRAEQAELANAERVGAWLAQHAEPGSLFSGTHELGAIAGLLPSPIDAGRPEPPQTWPHIAWRTWIATRHGVDARPPWQPVHTDGPYRVYAAERPAGVDTRCLFGELGSNPSDDFPRSHGAVVLEAAEGCAPGPEVGLQEQGAAPRW